MNSTLLPTTLCQAAIEILNEYWKEHGLVPQSLEVREAALTQLSQKVTACILEEHASADSLQLEPEPCRCGGSFIRHEQHRERTVVTTVAVVTLQRAYYQCRGCGATCLPLDRAWGLEARGCLSPRAHQQLSEMSAAMPYAEAHHWWLEWGRPSISLATVWRTTQKAGAKLVAQFEAQQKASQTREGSQDYLMKMRSAGAAGQHALLADGVFIRMDGQPHEVKVGVVGQLDGKGNCQRDKVTYFATGREAAEFRFGFVRHALSRGVTRRTRLALISDGGPWIEPLSARHYSQAVEIRDWFHVMGYVWQAAKSLYGEDVQKVTDLVKRLEKQLWKGRIKTLLRMLARAAQESPPQGEPAQEGYRATRVYFENHKHAMKYAAYRLAGWPMGSGHVESACKGLVKARMARPGMDWSSTGAEHLLFVRSLYYAKIPLSCCPPN